MLSMTTSQQWTFLPLSIILTEAGRPLPGLIPTPRGRESAGSTGVCPPRVCAHPSPHSEYRGPEKSPPTARAGSGPFPNEQAVCRGRRQSLRCSVRVHVCMHKTPAGFGGRKKLWDHTQAPPFYVVSFQPEHRRAWVSQTFTWPPSWL